VVVVAQPFFRPDAQPVVPGRGGKDQVHLVEPIRAAVELRQQGTAAPGIGRERVGRRDSCGVCFELIGSE